MKPIILPITVNDQGKVSMTLKELEDLLDKAYAAGKADGGEVHYDCPYQPWIVNPVSPNPSWTGSPIYTTDHATIGDGDSTSTTTTKAIPSNQQ